MMYYEPKLSWSAPYEKAVKEQMSHSYRKYHNWDHIKKCFWWFEQWQITPSPALEIATLFHDTVYDDLPNKELRSADFMSGEVGRFPLCAGERYGFPGPMVFDQHTEVVREARNIIHATIDHHLAGSKPGAWNLIRADLADLSDPYYTLINYNKILEESRLLYKIDHKTFARNNITFMKNLRHTVENNRAYDHDMWRPFWHAVKRGIIATIGMSEDLLG